MTGAAQTRIPGTEQKRIKALDELAEQYDKIKSKRCAFNREEVTLKQKLIESMAGEKMTAYVVDGVSIEVKVLKQGVKVVIGDEEDE